MRRVYIFFIFWAGALPALFVVAQGDYPSDKDSLRQLIAVSQGKEKLDAYKYLAVAYFFESKDELKMDTMLAIYAEMDAEAQRQGNINSGGILRYNILSAFHNAKRYDEVIRRAPEYLDFLEKKQAWSHYFNICHLWIKSYTSVYRFDKALSEAQKTYDKARSLNLEDGMANALYSIADIYGAQSRNEEEVQYLRRAAGLMKGKPALYPILANVYHDLCQSLLVMERYDEALTELEEFEKVNQLYEERVKQAIPTTRANLFGCYARLYNSIGEVDKAEYYTDKLDSIAQTPVYKVMSYRNRAKIFRARKQYDKALEMTDRMIELGTLPSGSPSDMVLKAAILADMGKPKESFELANAAILLKDTLNRMEYNKQLDGLRAQYEVDMYVAEKERIFGYFLFTLAGCLLLAVALGIWVYYNRKIQMKNRALAGQIRVLVAQQEARDAELLNKTSFVGQQQAAGADDLCPESRMDKLCNAIRDLILKDKAYRNALLTRDSLVTQLGTNRELFVEAFSYCFGMSFPEYINSLRLQDAVTLLQQSDLPIEAISEKTGFGSLRTFQRQFLKKYNLSPKDYRKAEKTALRKTDGDL